MNDTKSPREILIVRSTLLTSWLCAAAALLAIIAMNPHVEMGVNDDFSYIYSAKVLAETGHVVYNGWAGFPLGWQLYLAELFIKTFGFSFTAVRAANMLVAFVAVPILHRILLRFGVRPWNALVATLTVVLSPLYLGLATGFMSDISSFFAMLLCLYACVRSVQAETDKAAVAWLIAAAGTNIVAGTVRQVVWLGVLVMVPSTAWYLRRRRPVFVAGMLSWAISIPLIALFLQWFDHQPYVPVVELIAVHASKSGITSVATYLAQLPLTLLLLPLPILVAFAVCFPFRSAWKTAFLPLGATAVLMAAAMMIHHGIPWLGLLLGNYVHHRGLIYMPALIGKEPDTFTPLTQAFITFTIFAVGTLGLLEAWRAYHSSSHAKPTAMDVAARWLLGPFCIAYILLTVTREGIFDRYFLPLLGVAVIFAARFFEQHVGKDFSRWCLLPIILLSAYGVVGGHDAFAMRRARLAAANELLAAGIPRSQFRAGFEYDAWTEISLIGHLNEPHIRVPAGTYLEWIPPAGLTPDCTYPFQAYTPAIHARFGVTGKPGFCFPDAGLPPVRYRTWLPPQERAFYFVAIPQLQR